MAGMSLLQLEHILWCLNISWGGFCHPCSCLSPLAPSASSQASWLMRGNPPPPLHYEGPGTSNCWLTGWRSPRDALLSHVSLLAVTGSIPRPLGNTGLWPASERTSPQHSKHFLLSGCHRPAPRERNLYFTSLKPRPTLIKVVYFYYSVCQPNQKSLVPRQNVGMGALHCLSIGSLRLIHPK